MTSKFYEGFKLSSELRVTTLPTLDGPFLEIVVSSKQGTYEADLSQQLLVGGSNAKLAIDCLRGTGTLIDVGAHIGTISLPVAMSGSNTISVEMMPKNVMQLRASVLLNCLTNIRVIQAAASDQDGIVRYWGEEAWGTIGAGDHAAAASTLDSLCALIELGEPDFIKSPVFLKIDVENHEPEVMRGALNLISAFRPYVLFESIDFTDSRGEVAASSKEIMLSMNYQLHLVSRINVLLPPDRDAPQVGLVCDYLAVPDERTADVKEAFPNFEVRELTDDELVFWLLKDAYVDKDHRLHVLKYLDHKLDQGPLRKPFNQVINILLADNDPEVTDRAAQLARQF